MEQEISVEQLGADPDILFDYSKNRITEKTMSLLFGLARAAGVEARRDGMFTGNASAGGAAGALRSGVSAPQPCSMSARSAACWRITPGTATRCF